jgi:SOS-response transcriptional repressor LexA
MGEDFIRKRQQGFARRTDAAYKAQLKQRDLFSGVQPGATREVVGFLLQGVNLPSGSSLSEVAEAVITRTRIVLAAGNARAVELDGEGAVQLRRAEKALGGPLSKTVKAISPEGLVTIVLGIPAPKPGGSGGES